MTYSKALYSLDPSRALICLLILTSPFAAAETKQINASAGIDSVNNNEVWLFHPFPSRTYFAELKYNY